MTKRSAGILLYRRSDQGVEILLVHPGGPFWARKDEGAWSIPKGEYDEGDDPRAAASREFAEEIGRPLPDGEPVGLGEVKQPGGKLVVAWAVEGSIDADHVVSNTFTIEWPPRSGKTREFPEVDRAEWFTVPAARIKILKGQLAFVDRLLAHLDGAPAQW